jgi:Putative prokaryotic signal transducing protein
LTLGSKSKLVSVFSGNYLQAQIVKGRLETEGIPALLRYEGAGLIYGVTVDGLGEARVMVPEDLAAEAEAIVANHEYGEPEDMTEDERREEA